MLVVFQIFLVCLPPLVTVQQVTRRRSLVNCDCYVFGIDWSCSWKLHTQGRGTASWSNAQQLKFLLFAWPVAKQPTRRCSVYLHLQHACTYKSFIHIYTCVCVCVCVCVCDTLRLCVCVWVLSLSLCLSLCSNTRVCTHPHIHVYERCTYSCACLWRVVVCKAYVILMYACQLSVKCNVAGFAAP